MKPAERRKLENQQQKEIVRQKKYTEFKAKHRKLCEHIESDKFQIWYESITGTKWAWPYSGESWAWYAYCVSDIEEAKETLRKSFLPKNTWKKYADKRRQAMINASPVWRDLQEIEKIYQERDYQNALHGPGTYHVDHVIPLQGDRVSGLHCEFNLRVIQARENLVKHNAYTP